MIGFTHAAVGGFIAKFLPLPLAVPAAFASHFLLDMLPHYGIAQNKRNQWFWKFFTTTDFVVAWAYLSYISLSRHHVAIFACAVVAASPDFLWVARIIRTRSFDLSSHKSRFTQWHADIQQYERPWGIYIEVPLAVLLGYLVFMYW